MKSKWHTSAVRERTDVILFRHNQLSPSSKQPAPMKALEKAKSHPAATSNGNLGASDPEDCPESEAKPLVKTSSQPKPAPSGAAGKSK